MTANLDQSRDKAYTSEALEHFIKTCKAEIGEKNEKKDRISFALISLFEILLVALAAKRETLDVLDIISSEKLTSMTNEFKETLLASLKASLKKSKKLGDGHKVLRITSTLDALEALGVDGVKLNDLTKYADSFILLTKDKHGEVVERLENFMAQHIRNEDGDATGIKLGGNVETIYGRQAILNKVRSLIEGKDHDDKLELLESLCGRETPVSISLDQLLSTYHVMKLCAGSLKLPIIHST